MINLIDGDIIAYTYSAVNEPKASFTPEVTDYTFKKILAEFIYNLGLETKADSYLGYLTPSKVFRHDIATIKPYKGNRKDKPKPKYLPKVREILIEEFGFVLLNDIEADDAMSIVAKQRTDTIICTTDKDLMQVAGLNYNFKKKELIKVSSNEAIRFLWEQVLSGDSTDNIGGIGGIGAVKAKRILENIPISHLHKAVLDFYIKHYPTFVEALEAYRENFRLVYLLKEYESFKIEEPKLIENLKEYVQVYTSNG